MEVLDYLATNTTALLVTCLLLGLIVGSFLNVVIYRLPIMMENDWDEQCCELLEVKSKREVEPLNLATPHSSCPTCGHGIKPWENIPVISYLFLGGKCSSCKSKISIRYPIIELVSGLLSAAVCYLVGYSLALPFLLLFTWSLIALTMIDYDVQLLPDQITLPLMWIGLACNSYGLFTDITSALWGAIWGYMSLWLMYWAFKLLTGKEGMGFGDFKLLAALGAWMGWQSLFLIIILSSFVGAFVGFSLILFRGRDRSIPIPFGPYLAVAGWIAFFWGNKITAFYYQWAGMAPL